MGTLVAVLAGAVFGLGVWCLVRGLSGSPLDDESVRPSRQVPFAERLSRIDRIGLRTGAAVVAAVVIGVLTGWPVGVLLAGIGGFAAPSLLGRRARREAGDAHLDAIATWTEQLHDVMAAAAGLEQAIIATAEHAPTPIRDDVRWLAATLGAGTTMRTGLRRFAERLDDPAGDLVVAALILAAEGSPRQLGDLLSRLAVTTRDTVKMRLRVETGRARTRSSVAVVTTVTIVFSVGIVVLNPTYVAAYRSPAGQLVLLAVAGFFTGAYWWLARTSRPAATSRILAPGALPAGPLVNGTPQ
jgi:tight adherence protein B